MKKITKYLLLLAVMTAGCMTADHASAKNVVAPQMYMFGFAASFNDTIVHFTEVQQVDSTWIDTKNKFLQGRDNYSYQLRDYLANQLQMPHRTCIVVFNQNRAKLEKEFIKLKKKYDNGKLNHFDVRTIARDDFKFQAIDMSGAIEEQPVAKPEKKKKEKGKKRHARK